MVKLIPAKLQGSSLVEVTVAMVLLSVVIGASFLLFASLAGTSGSLREQKALAVASAHAAETLDAQLYFDATDKKSDFLVSRIISPYLNRPELIMLEVFVMGENGDTLASRREIIYVAR